MRDGESNRQDDSIYSFLRRLGTARRKRMVEDSNLNLARYLTKMSAIAIFVFVDALLVPSLFQFLGFLSTGFTIPLFLAILALVIIEAKFVSHVK